MSKLRDAVYGFAVGDALGVPFEFRERDTFKCEGMTGYGTHYQPPGTWSDDTSMMLATCHSIKENGCIALYDMMKRFYMWMVYGYYTPNGKVFDIGSTTSRAICNFGNGLPLEHCGLDGERDNGNGALMRILPLAFMEAGANDVYDVARLTHRNVINGHRCCQYILLCRMLMEFPDIKMGEQITNRSREEVKSGGYVVDTFEAALWAFGNTNSYEECVLTAVNLGGDTDTVAALAGALAGIKYGYDSIPLDWITKLKAKDLIENCLFES